MMPQASQMMPQMMLQIAQDSMVPQMPATQMQLSLPAAQIGTFPDESK